MADSSQEPIIESSVSIDPAPAPPKLDKLLPGQPSSQLRVGDTIALVIQRGDKLCFVGSEGFVELGGSLRELDLSTTVPWKHVDCLWVVEQKHQYDAQKALRKSKKAKNRGSQRTTSTTGQSSDAPMDRMAGGEEFGAVNNVGKNGKAIARTAQVLMHSKSARALLDQEQQRKAQEELVSALRAEQQSNALCLEEKRGTPITYGETIQLMHMKSRKYLVFYPKRRSQSLGCYSVRLDSEGSEDAWLAICPRHSFQFEGGCVHNHDLLTLHSTKRQLWLHVGRTSRRAISLYLPVPSAPCIRTLLAWRARILPIAR